MTLVVAGRILGAYLVAVAVAYLLGAMAATQAVLANLEAMGIAVSMGDRLRTTGQDIVGLLPAYGVLIAVAFAIALPTATAIARFVPAWRAVGLVAAGAMSIAATHLIMHAAFDITPLAAARTTTGLAVQALAGGVGGYAFYFLRQP